METPGLRERKKQHTRELIAETARRLFAERGFERVTVAEVARAADVSQQTVFNYFPTKEDLVYWRLESFEEELLSTVRNRAPGESVLAAFGRFMLVQRGLLASDDPAARERLTNITTMIVESLWKHIKHRDLAQFNRPRLDLVTHLVITNVLPRGLRTMEYIQNLRRIGRPRKGNSRQISRRTESKERFHKRIRDRCRCHQDRRHGSV